MQAVRQTQGVDNSAGNLIVRFISLWSYDVIIDYNIDRIVRAL